MIPCCINAKGQPHTVEVESAEGQRWLDYFQGTARAEGFETVVEAAPAQGPGGADLLILRPSQTPAGRRRVTAS